MRKLSLFPLAALLIISAGCSEKNSQGEGFLNQVDQINIQDDSHLLGFFEKERSSIEPAYLTLPQGSVAPKGWILDMMETDLETGMVGALDDLYPGIKKDDLYNIHRRAGLDDVPEMGDLVLTGEPWEKSIMWWNAETAGNWWDGFVRHAYLTQNEEAIQQAKAIVDNLIDSQDEDGYIGIYKPSLRYQHDGSNGELWAQTTAFRTLLGYYQITGDTRALNAVEKAMAVTMKEYGPNGINPFKLKNAYGGVTHGLMLTDVCETLFSITGKVKYQDFATHLYKAFSTYNINRAFNDLRYPYLIQRDSLFTGHGVHTYEHFRTLINAYYHTGYPELKTAFENSLYKLQPAILPSGAGHGNEWLLGIPADPTYTASEYCTMLELRNSLSSIFQKTGLLEYADHAEKLTYSGMLGFRNAEGTALTYGKADNTYVLDGMHYGEKDNHKDSRYKYSPTHSDPAVCCVPNYSRNLPYFLDQMWLKSEDGLVLALYGPSVLSTQFKGTNIRIEQETNYPYTDNIKLKVSVDQPVSFPIYLRKPKWSDGLEIKGMESDLNDGFYKVEKEWSDDDEIEIIFQQSIQKNSASNGEVYLQRGPLVYALSIPHSEKVLKEYAIPGFRDYYCIPENSFHENLSINPEQINPVFSNNGSPKLKLMVMGNNDQTTPIELVPIGNTVLRRTTFPTK